MKLVHVQTVVQTTFGLVDDDGNVLPQEPLQIPIQILKPESFQEAYVSIVGTRDRTIANLPQDEVKATKKATKS